MPGRISRSWVRHAIGLIDADFNRSADTHLLPVELPAAPGIHLYLKDESTHPTGSLKHRLARSLVLYGLCNGWIGEGTTIVEASSGSTAVSEAFFARLLGLPFVAVMPRSTSAEKVSLIERWGGRCHFVDGSSEIYDAAAGLARECGGHYMDQFTYAERVTDWRGNNTIAESIFAQLALEPFPVPRWIVTSAGTGGTSATLGRYVRYRRYPTRVCVVDPENSVFFDFFRTGDRTLSCARNPAVEGIGRPRVEPSFLPGVVDCMFKVPDAASFAAIRFLAEALGRRFGGSTGTGLWGALSLIARMRAAGHTGSVVTLACDSGDRYLRTYYDDSWIRANGVEIDPWLDRLRRFHATGEWVDDGLRRSGPVLAEDGDGERAADDQGGTGE